jgi:outer membrane protein W
MILSSQLIAQEDTTSCEQNSLKPGMWALQYTVGYDLSLQSWAQGQLCAKKQVSNNSAIRAVIGLRTKIEDGNYSYRYHGYGIDISGLYQYYSNPFSLLKFYYGVGPILSYSWTKEENPSSSYQKLYKNNSVSCGISGILGVEWFVNKSISFLAESSSSAKYSWYRNEYIDNSGERKNTRKSFSISDVGSRLGISLYF